jgi:hypothetical protein
MKTGTSIEEAATETTPTGLLASELCRAQETPHKAGTTEAEKLLMLVTNHRALLFSHRTNSSLSVFLLYNAPVSAPCASSSVPRRPRS